MNRFHTGISAPRNTDRAERGSRQPSSAKPLVRARTSQAAHPIPATSAINGATTPITRLAASEAAATSGHTRRDWFHSSSP